MISAKEAREKTNKARRIKTELFLNHLDKDIKESISKGQDEIYLNEYISDILKEEIEKFGYQVTRFSDPREEWTKIRW